MLMVIVRRISRYLIYTVSIPAATTCLGEKAWRLPSFVREGARLGLRIEARGLGSAAES